MISGLLYFVRDTRFATQEANSAELIYTVMEADLTAPQRFITVQNWLQY